MKRNNHGFSLIEIIVVLVLISIIAAAVFTRSITTEELNLAARTEKIQGHIRFAQSMALKKNEPWGIASIGTQYWLFRGYKPADFLTGQRLPGENTDKIILTGSGLGLNPFSLYFDHIGKPYLLLDYDNPVNTKPVSASFPLIITITSTEDITKTRKLSITPETGLIVLIP